MFHKKRNRIRAAAVCAAVITSALVSPLSISGAKYEIPSAFPSAAITANASGSISIDDFPSDYQYAADWIWENRIENEKSTERRNTIFDQIVAGKGSINYVVRWQSYKTVTLEQRQKFETLVSDSINAWNDWLAGYENWPYDHIDVNIVGWAVLDESSILDKQDDEIIYTNLTDYDSSGDTSNGVETIPDKLPNAPSELSRFDHFADAGYEYPGGLDKRFDMYLWATQGFPSIGGCGGDWGQRLSDDAYINMLDGYGIHVLEHEIGHGFGMTDFYGGEGESDGFPPGGFPGGENSIMMAGSASKITDFDGWMLRYMWTQIKDDAGRFDIEETPVVTTTTTQQPDVTTTTTTTNPDKITYPSEIFSVEDAVSADITLRGTAYAGINGAVGYWADDSWHDTPFEGTLDANGRFTFNFEVPSGVDEIQVQIYWSGVWDNDKGEVVDVPAEIAGVQLNKTSAMTTTTTTTTVVPGSSIVSSGTAIAEVDKTENYWSFHATGASSVDLIFNADPFTGANGGIGYWDNSKYDPEVEGSGWQTATWDGTFSEDGELICSFPLPEGIDEVQVQCYWSQVWDNTLKEMVDTDVDLVQVILHFGDDSEGGTTTTTTTTTTTSSSSSTTTSTTTSTSSSMTSTTTTTTNLPPVTMYGDADCSGDVEIADAVKIMCYLTDPENNPIDPQGMANGDVYQIGDGLSVQDALSIQKYLAQIIKSLPES